MPLTTFLFDLDGTLIDSIELIRQSFNHTFTVHHGAPPSEEAWLTGLGTPLRNQFRAIGANDAELEAMVATYREYNFANHDRMVRPYPDAIETVRTLKDRGMRLGVVTSKQQRGAMRGLNHAGFEGLFEVVVAADDVTKHKPDPTPVLHALQLLGVEARGAVFIGDSPHDLAAGRSAGTSTAAALWGPFPRSWLEPHAPDHWLEAPSQVAGLA